MNSAAERARNRCRNPTVRIATVFAALALIQARNAPCSADDYPAELQKWMQPQPWERDTNGPILSLGEPGQFDDTHVLAPCAARFNDRFHLWYSGASGAVSDRVFRLGLATGSDGRNFVRHTPDAVYEFGDEVRSVLTATILRETDGTVIRENGKLRMWFSAADLTDTDGLHTLHETTSSDGIHWAPPSPALLDHVYAPTILKTDNGYRLWYTDVSDSVWCIRTARSSDGRDWQVNPTPALSPESDWEKSRLFYPHVLKTEGVYLMWYGSYWSGRSNTTAIGTAVSLDGEVWYRNPHNPVLRPDPTRPWESHYTTSHSVIRDADGRFRIWYAGRKEPPFRNKYFSLNTATWGGPNNNDSDPEVGVSHNTPDDAETFSRWQSEKRQLLTDMLGIAEQPSPLNAEKRSETETDSIVLEKWVYTSESGSKIPAVLYRPAESDGPIPGVVLTFGHGGSKSHPCYQYIGQLYAKLGIACLAADPIGEEERHYQGKTGTRAHDPAEVHHRARAAGRPVMGKLVGDTMRGVDFLLSREDIDPDRIGVAGNSLGGAEAGWMAALDTRLRFAIVSGWAFDDVTLDSKFCTSVPNTEMRKHLSWEQYALLSAPHCSLTITNGDADTIIDKQGEGVAWRGTREVAAGANAVLEHLKLPPTIETWFEPGGGHRPYPAHPEVVARLYALLFPDRPLPDLKPLSFGEWCDRHHIRLERLYGTPLHLRGATVTDLSVKYMQPESLAVLRSDERGTAEFTLRGWLQQIEQAAEHPSSQ